LMNQNVFWSAVGGEPPLDSSTEAKE
jgi:hypothetical protein